MIASQLVWSFFLVTAQAASVPVCSEYDIPREEVVRGEVGAKSHDFLLGMTENGFSGAVLVSRRGKIVLKKGYGYANFESMERNTSETLFNVASVAKTFTAATVLDLDAKRMLSVDDRLVALSAGRCD